MQAGIYMHVVGINIDINLNISEFLLRFRKENNIKDIKDVGSQLFIQVNDMLVQGSADRYFYLPGNYRYKLFGQTEKTENIILTNLQWEKGGSVKE